MTTTIPNFYRNSYASIEITLDLEGPAMVNVAILNNTYPGLNIDRDAFLDAVRSELGVLIINKADLPEVTDRAVLGNLFIGGTPWPAGASPQVLRQAAYDRLALAEYLEAHPQVDEQQVEALAPLLWEHTQTASGPGDSWDEITDAERNRFKNRAGRLIATGKVTVQP